MRFELIALAWKARDLPLIYTRFGSFFNGELFFQPKTIAFLMKLVNMVDLKSTPL